MTRPEAVWTPILFNPIAGRTPKGRRVAELVAALRGAGLRPEIFDSRDRLLTALDERVGREPPRCVVAGGGDGTLNWLVNHCSGSPIAAYPLGSENLLARWLGTTTDPQAMTQTILQGRTIRLDVGRANGQRFLLMAGVGLDAEVVARVHRDRSSHVTRWNYVQATITELVRHRRKPVRVHCDGDVLTGMQVALVNVPTYALGLCPAPNADPSDGMLDVVVFREWSTFRCLGDLMRMRRGRLAERPDLFFRRSLRVEIESDEPVAVQVDGDPAGQLPARFDIDHQALELIVPPERASAVPSRIGPGAVTITHAQ